MHTVETATELMDYTSDTCRRHVYRRDVNTCIVAASRCGAFRNAYKCDAEARVYTWFRCVSRMIYTRSRAECTGCSVCSADAAQRFNFESRSLSRRSLVTARFVDFNYRTLNTVVIVLLVAKFCSKANIIRISVIDGEHVGT